MTLPVPGPGRDSLYDVSMNDMVRKLALLGLTDKEIAEFFGVTERTLNNWKNEYPAFFQSLSEGKTIADAEVADSLYKRATGEHVIVEKAYRNKTTGEVEIVKVKQFIPGESGAAKLWLTNRRRQNWADSQNVNLTGSLDISTKEQRDAAVAAATRADR
ncbi:MAG: helix-turn-helix domain-containing protein [Rhizobiaceae bacterium]